MGPADKIEVRSRFVDGFLALDADREEHLAEYFVRPDIFSLIAREASVAAFINPGAGHSALLQYLKGLDQGRHLWVTWPHYGRGNDDLRQGWIASFFEELAVEIATYLAHHPDRFQQATDWICDALGSFVKSAILGDLALTLGYLFDEAPFLWAWLEEARPFETLDMHPEKATRLLAPALRQVGLEGIIVLASIKSGDEAAVTMLEAGLFQSMPFLENAGFVVKAFLPSRLLEPLGGTAVVRSRRILPLQLAWSEADLRRIVDQRLGWVLGKDDGDLSEICENPEDVWAWIAMVGGRNPRAWLRQVRPLIEAYISDGKPVSEARWQTLLEANPPTLLYPADQDRDTVWVGGRKIALTEMGPQEREMFEYLFANRNRIVTREELYYHVIRELDYVPSLSDDMYEKPAAFRGSVDTLIWRMRQIIEPDPSHPLLLQTIRSQGIILRIV